MQTNQQNNSKHFEGLIKQLEDHIKNINIATESFKKLPIALKAFADQLLMSDVLPNPDSCTCGQQGCSAEELRLVTTPTNPDLNTLLFEIQRLKPDNGIRTITQASKYEGIKLIIQALRPYRSGYCNCGQCYYCSQWNKILKELNLV